MKTEARTVYVARDGRDFPTKAKCRAHERETCGQALVGLTAAQIEAVRMGADPELAEAIEIFGAQLRTRRQAKGELKRRPRPDGPEAGQEIGEEEGHAQPQ